MTDSFQVYGPRLLSGQIRLLDILPADSGRHDANARSSNRICCKLRSVHLAQARFTAISYVWGEKENLRSVELNNVNVQVTANAFAVLEILSGGSPSESYAHPEVTGRFANSKIWLDAICMNQSDEKEKEAQVQIMQDIYDRAENTLIWLGSPAAADRGAGRAINFLRRIVGCMSFEAFLSAGQEGRLHLWDESSWASAHELMSQPWFHRRWVIQEAALSRDPWVLYGGELISWADFSDGVERLAYLFSDQINKPRFQNTPPALLFDIEPTLAIKRLRRADIRNSGQPLIYLLSQFRRCDSSVPHDRIFALLGLCGEAERAANNPIYQMSIRDVLVRMACAHVRIFNNLDILCIATEAARVLRRETPYWRGHVRINPDQVGMPRSIHMYDLPTWVPNVTSMYTNWVFGQEPSSYRESPRPLFDASCGYHANVSNIGECRASGVLIVRGIEVDVIDAIEPHTPVPSPDHQYSNSLVFENMFDFAHRYWRPGGVYSSDLDFLTAYLRTITAGGRRESTRDFLTDEYLRYYCLTFFSPAQFGDRLQARYGTEPGPREQRDRYIDPDAGAKYNDNARLSFDRLCFNAFACTKKGRMALVPPHTQPGDRICVLYGCSSPLLLQPSETRPGHYCTRGEVYMDGIMFGGAIEQMMNRLLEEGTFHLQ